MKIRAAVIRVAMACVVLVAVVVLFGLLAPRPTREPGVTPENFRWLRAGMSLQEAEAVLGPSKRELEVDDVRVYRWYSDRCRVRVLFQAMAPNEHLLKAGSVTKDGNDAGSIGKEPASWREWITGLLGL